MSARVFALITTVGAPFGSPSTATPNRAIPFDFSEKDAMSRAMTVALNSPRPRLRVTFSPAENGHSFLPPPALLSPSSRYHIYTNPAFSLLGDLRRSSELLLRSIIVRVVDYSTHQGFWLALYFVLNLVLTLYNKILLVSLPYPYTLTAVHALFGCLGGSWLRFRNVYRPKALWGTDYLLLIGFSFLYSTNIAVSNVSLDLVTVPFHQIIRATTPIFTTALSWHFLGTHFDRRQMAAIIVVILGVGFATYGDYCFTSWGLALTLAGTILAAVKTMATHAIQAAPSVRHSGPLRRRCYYPYMSFGFLALPTTSLPRLRRYHLQLHPLDLLTRLSTLAFLQCVIYAHISGEMNFVLKSSTACGQTLYLCRMWQTALLFGNGIIACLLNIVSFEANRRSGALSMSVAANVKQALTILCAVWMFRLTITPVNVAGIALTILGGAWYAILECQSKSSRA